MEGREGGRERLTARFLEAFPPPRTGGREDGKEGGREASVVAERRARGARKARGGMRVFLFLFLGGGEGREGGREGGGPG